METKMITRIKGAGLLRWLSFVAFGATIFTSATNRFNLFSIGFGIVLCLILGWFYRHFLIAFLGLFNPSIKKEYGKTAIPIAIHNSMLYLVPFAILTLLSTYYLKWTMTGSFISTGIMVVGVASAMEVGKLRSNPVRRNTIISLFVSFLFSFLITMSTQLMSRIPSVIEGAVGMLPTFLGKGGGF